MSTDPLPDDYTRLFDALLEDVGGRVPSGTELTALWPMRGVQFQGQLMIVGRASNGWDPKWTPAEALDPARRSDLVARIRARSSAEGRCPMLWLLRPEDGYCGKRGPRAAASAAAFWRVSRQVLAELQGGRGDAAWPSALAWSNLYKVAPWYGWNPSTRLCAAQFRVAPRLLRIEVEAFAPIRVLVMAGRTWFQRFATELGLRVQWREGLVEGIVEEPPRRWVIAKHPMRKPERQFVQEVAAAFRA